MSTHGERSDDQLHEANDGTGALADGGVRSRAAARPAREVVVTSTALMIGLVGIYVLTAGVSGYEGNWPRVLYWVSAAGITSAVVWGMK